MSSAGFSQLHLLETRKDERITPRKNQQGLLLKFAWMRSCAEHSEDEEASVAQVEDLEEV